MILKLNIGVIRVIMIGCLFPAHWKQHIESEKHKNEGKRKPRSDKKFEPKCKVCHYTTTRTTNMKLHYLNHHDTKEEQKKSLNIIVKGVISGILQRHCIR